MATVHDTFTDGSGQVSLTSHTPDTDGTSWVEEINTGSTLEVDCFGSSGYAGPDNYANTYEVVVTSRPDPSSAEYDITAELSGVEGSSESGSKPWGLVARFDGTEDDAYIFQLMPDSYAENAYKIFKRVGGTDTELASVDGATVVGDVFKFEIRDASKKVYKNSTEILSTSDNTITDAGSAGMGWGDYFPNGDHVRTDYQVTEYSVEEVSSSSPVTVACSEGQATGAGLSHRLRLEPLKSHAPKARLYARDCPHRLRLEPLKSHAPKARLYARDCPHR